jgi:hypothetical protein
MKFIEYYFCKGFFYCKILGKGLMIKDVTMYPMTRSEMMQRNFLIGYWWVKLLK